MAHNPWHDVVLPADLSGPIPAVIEIPKGSKVKYEIDKSSGLLMVDRVLFSAVHYPANYGFVPRTFCGDGDALDILVLCDEAIVPLAVMRARVIGVMRMHDDKGQDDKLIAVHADDPEQEEITDVSQLRHHRLRELKQFFADYKQLEHKRVAISTPQGREPALRILEAAQALYARERGRLLVEHPVEPPPAPRVLPRKRRASSR